MTMAIRINLGEDYRDRFSGFEGVATAITKYLYGCERVLLESRTETHEGKPIERWEDIQRLDWIGEGDAEGVVDRPKAAIGGPGRSTPPARPTG